MRLIDGNAIAQQVLAEVKERVAKLAPVVPHVAFVRVGDDPASVSYVTKKQKTAAEVGMKASLQLFPETVTKEELFAHLDALNADASVHGILIQAPLPKHLPETEVFNRVSPDKDVDGFGTQSIGRLVQEVPGAFAACTPAGVVELLRRSGVETAGKHAVVVGRSLWPDAMSALISGGGLKMGQVVGSTDRQGAYPADRPLTPKDLLATIYRHLGIDYRAEYRDKTGRPLPILAEGDPIRELI